MNTKIYYRTPKSWVDVIQSLLPDDVDATWVDAAKPLDEQAKELKDAIAVFTLPSLFHEELAKQCPNLKLVQVFSAGTEQIDIPALGELGIKVANNNGGNAPAVAEHTVALMVGVYRKLNTQFEAARDGKWAGDFFPQWFSETFELTDKTVGIIGLGRIGKQVAKRLHGWDCKLLYYDIADISATDEQGLNATKTPLDELLKTSDIVSLHVPLTNRTHHMISERELKLMKPTAVLISTCRGPVVDEEALIDALNNGTIRAAGLDVLDQEPPSSDNPLLHMDNAVVSPHLAGMSQEAQIRNVRFAIQNVIKVTQGGEPESVVLPD